MSNKISILGINCAYHESSACLIQDGKLIAAVEEERFNRIKHAKPANIDNADELPIQSIEFCLQSGGLTDLAKVDFIGYSLKPEERLRQNLQHQHCYAPTPNDFGTPEGEQLFIRPILGSKKSAVPWDFADAFSTLIIMIAMQPVRFLSQAINRRLYWLLMA